MTRPYLRHSIDQLESMPASAELLAELEHRTTPRARKLLAKLKSGTVMPVTIDARPVAAAKGERKPVARSKVPAKPVASVRAGKPPRRVRSKLCGPDPLAGYIDNCRSVSWRDQDYISWYTKKFGREWDPMSQAGCHGFVERDAATGRIKQAVGDYGKVVWDAEQVQLPIAA